MPLNSSNYGNRGETYNLLPFIMITSLIVYIGLMLIMTAFSIPAGERGIKKYGGVIFASLLYAVVFGIRYNVGTDFPMYLKGYEQILNNVGGWEANRWEIGYQIFFLFPAHLGLPYPFGFGIIAFIQIFLIYVGLRRHPSAWKFIPITLILSWICFAYANIMRHMVAFSIFVAAIPYLADKKYLKYLICIAIAMSFHKSAAILFPFPLIYHFRKEIFSSIKVQYALLVVALYIMNIDFVQQMFDSATDILVMFGYDFYEDTKFAEFDTSATVGLGFLTVLGLSVFLITFSNKLKRFYRDRAIAIMYDMYFIGVLVRFAFARMFLMQRLNYYFFSFEFIIAALAMEYFYQKKKYWPLCAILGLYLLLFMGRLGNLEGLQAMYQTFLDR